MEMPITARSSVEGGASRAYLDHVRRDAAFYGFVAAYAIAGLLIGSAAGVPHKVLPLSYFVGAAQSFPLALALGVATTGVWSLRSREPLAAWRSSIVRAFSPHVVAGVLLFVTLCLFMAVFSSIKQMLTDVAPFFADPYLADLDARLHWQDPWLITTAAMPLRLMPALEALYLGTWGLMLVVSMLAVLFVPAMQPVRAQYVWTFLLVWSVLGNVLAAAVMSAGPVFYENVTGDPRFAGLIAYLERNSGQGLIQTFLWSAYSGNEPGVVGAGISAFPSMHVASATMCALVAANAHRWLRWAGVAYCAVIMFGSVHLGWHYAVDGYFSIAATVLIWKVVGWAQSTRRRPAAS